MLEFSLISLFFVGLLGGGHCVGMCGGIVGAVSMSLPQTRSKLPFLIAYNSGRIFSYALAGALAGAIGASSFFLSNLFPIEKTLYAIASLMLVLLGLYLSGFSTVLMHFENLGKHIWQRIQPFGKRFIPVQTQSQAFFLGMIWGWLPCGLVYSVLIAALASGSPFQGALIMLCFGLGTLPTLLAMGMTAIKLKQYLQKSWVRKLSGFLILSFGVIGLYRVIYL